MGRFIQDGGMGMWFTLALTLPTVLSGAAFVVRGRPEQLRAFFFFSGLTLASGALGFCLGQSIVLNVISRVSLSPSDARLILTRGTYEALHNLVLALAAVVFGGSMTGARLLQQAFGTTEKSAALRPIERCTTA